MHISEEGLVAGSVNRAELVAAYEAATDPEVRANLAAAGAAHGMSVQGNKLVDPSTQEPEPAQDPSVSFEDTDDESDDEPGAREGEPPRGGPGSGRTEWADYANTQGVEVTEDMNRDDIIAAVDASRE